MGESWRNHLVDEGNGTMRIKAHGSMLADARIVADKEHMNLHRDDRGPEQLVNIASMPGIVGEAWAMADWHYGYGFPIGGVVATDENAGEQGGAISPGGVGFDINCGVRFLALDATESDIPNLKKLAGRLNGRIPAGGSGKGGVDLTRSNLKELLQGGAEAALDLGYGHDEDLKFLESQGILQTENADVSERALERGMKSLGTLGSGNHFLELQTVGKVVDEQTAKEWGLFDDQIVAMIHSGSRGLGHQVCTDHVRHLESKYKLSEGMWTNESWGFSLPDRQLASAPIHSKEGQEYLDAMNAAANFAFANRAVLASRLRTVLKLEMGDFGEARTLYDVAHNIAKLETHHVHGATCSCYVHRKGATRAFSAMHDDIASKFSSTGQPVIVPGDMGTGSWMMAGPLNGENQAFGSSCHGAGRALSRAAAKKSIDGKALKHELESRGIRIHASTPNILAEEAPDAYKDVDEVIRLTTEAGLARPVVRLNPLAVIKG
ncbi:MAG: RNA-splicing ligase RtcB [Euryarchaeota archaeon]|nr:RNA-splicing ligase RtcB [Euryarchaeota archaeon]|tara:strand:+ start:5786 stop:7261 length:1476 start_codon:yes stop_codon:yes gene_type:complete